MKYKYKYNQYVLSAYLTNFNTCLISVFNTLSCVQNMPFKIFKMKKTHTWNCTHAIYLNVIKQGSADDSYMYI